MPEEKRKFEQVDPGGDVDEYEYADSKEVDAKAKEKKAKGQDDGDRLVGGKITSTRFGTEVNKARNIIIDSRSHLLLRAAVN